MEIGEFRMRARLGCQTYTWEMLGNKWTRGIDDILNTISDLGFEGIEVSVNMIGAYCHSPMAFQDALSRRSLDLSAFALSSPYGFSDPKFREFELKEVRAALQFLTFFPGAILSLGGATSNEQDRTNRLRYACDFYNACARLGYEMGIVVAVHPHSHQGSLIETEEEYENLMKWTDSDCLKWNPDTGHISRGGQDLVDCLGRYKSRIAHIHAKDADSQGKWRPLGKGECELRGMLQVLKNIGYSSWIVIEDESPEAGQDPKRILGEDLRVMRGLVEMA